MKIPYVRVNNQKEFEKVVAKMERETGLNLKLLLLVEDGFFKDGFKIIGMSKNYEINSVSVWDKLYEKYIFEKIVSADEYLTGTRENFTLDDLEDGMVVELRDFDENLFFIFNKTLVGISEYDKTTKYNSNLSHILYKKLDIIKIYKPKNISSMRNILNRNDLTLIFDAETHRRNKSKVSQRKSEIENEIKKLQEELNNL